MKINILKKVIEDQWGYAHFPDDFETYAKSGKYSWKCIVNDRPVIQGEFEYIGYAGEAKILK